MSFLAGKTRAADIRENVWMCFEEPWVYHVPHSPGRTHPATLFLLYATARDTHRVEVQEQGMAIKAVASGPGGGRVTLHINRSKLRTGDLTALRKAAESKNRSCSVPEPA